jgi:parvulin-like peptidyl-prolyl isomerase
VTIVRNRLVVLAVVVVLLVAGIFSVLPTLRVQSFTVSFTSDVLATVGEEEIRREDYWRVRSYDLLNQANQYSQIAQFSESEQKQQYEALAEQALAELEDVWESSQVDDRTLSRMIDDQLYLQHMGELGLSITDQEVDDYIARQFEPANAPIYTPTPTQTLIPTRAAWATATAAVLDATASAVAAADSIGTPSSAQENGTDVAPSSSPTPNQEQARQTAAAGYRQFQDDVFGRAHMSPADYERLIVRPAIARDKVRGVFEAEIGQSAEQVHAAHILVATKDLADEIYRQLQQPDASFEEIAKDRSIDGSTAPNGGDLGWFPRGIISGRFDEAVFSLSPGQMSAPFQTDFGWHIVKIYSREPDRPLSEAARVARVDGAVQQWLEERRRTTDISSAPDPTPTTALPAFDSPPDVPPTPSSAATPVDAVPIAPEATATTQPTATIPLAGSESAEADRLVNEHSLRSEGGVREIVIVRSMGATVDDPAVRAAVESVTAALRAESEIVAAATNYFEWGTRDPGGAASLVSADRQTTIIIVTLAGDHETAVANVPEFMAILAGQQEVAGESFEILTIGDATLSATPAANVPTGDPCLPLDEIFPPDSMVVQAYFILERDFIIILERGFIEGLIDPVEIVVVGPLDDPAVQAAIDELSHVLVSGPLFVDATVYANAAGDLALVSLTLTVDSCSTEALDAVRKLRSEVIPRVFAGVPAMVLVTGRTARSLDQSVTSGQVNATPAVASPAASSPEASPVVGITDAMITVAVVAALPWTDTGLDVAAGAEVVLAATGTIGSGNQTDIPPAGLPDCTGGDEHLAPGEPCLALLMRLGDGPAVAVGAEGRLTSVVGGRLYLGVNDSLVGFGDNAGSWMVEVTVLPLVPAGEIVAAPPAVVGAAATPSDAGSWPTYENSALGVLLRYPVGWTIEEAPDRLVVTFRPQDANLDVPGAAITLVFLPDVPFDLQALPPPGMIDLGVVAIAGVEGRAYQDAALAVPTQSVTIALPHRGGTIVVAATIGPDLDLRPVLDQMLGTLQLLPA